MKAIHWILIGAAMLIIAAVIADLTTNSTTAGVVGLLGGMSFLLGLFGSVTLDAPDAD